MAPETDGLGMEYRREPFSSTGIRLMFWGVRRCGVYYVDLAHDTDHRNFWQKARYRMGIAATHNILVVLCEPMLATAEEDR